MSFSQKINSESRSSKLTAVNYSDSVEERMSCLFTTYFTSHTQPDSNKVGTTLYTQFLCMLKQ